MRFLLGLLLTQLIAASIPSAYGQTENCIQELSWANAVDNIEAPPTPEYKQFCLIDNSKYYKYPVRVASSDAFSNSVLQSFADYDWRGLIVDVLNGESREFSFGYLPSTINSIELEAGNDPSVLILGAKFEAKRLYGPPSKRNIRLKIDDPSQKIICVKFSYRPCRPLGQGKGDLIYRAVKSSKDSANERARIRESFYAPGGPNDVGVSRWPREYAACMDSTVEKWRDEAYRACPKNELGSNNPGLTGTPGDRCRDKVSEDHAKAKPNWELAHGSCMSLWK